MDEEWEHFEIAAAVEETVEVVGEVEIERHSSAAAVGAVVVAGAVATEAAASDLVERVHLHLLFSYHPTCTAPLPSTAIHAYPLGVGVPVH